MYDSLLYDLTVYIIADIDIVPRLCGACVHSNTAHSLSVYMYAAQTGMAAKGDPTAKPFLLSIIEKMETVSLTYIRSSSTLCCTPLTRVDVASP